MDERVNAFKALSDENRLLIIDMLSCGELCNCELIEGLNLTQPTVSHHMKILQYAGFVSSRKEGKWTYYSLNKDVFNDLCDFIDHLSSDKEDCICKRINKQDCNQDH